MNRLHRPTYRSGAGFALLAMAMLTPRAVQADTDYQIRAIVKQGETVGPVTIKPNGYFQIGTLNDRGQLAFVTATTPPTEALILYSEGQLLPIAYAGGDAPGGKWAARGFTVVSPVSMNQLGNLVFAPFGTSSNMALGTFLWEYETRKVTPIALHGQPAPNELTFLDADSGEGSPVINDLGEIAFPATFKDGAGRHQQGILFLGRDGKLLLVALSGQEMPDRYKIHFVGFPRINDAGSVAFLSRRIGEDTFSGYLWDKGPITPVAAAGTDSPGGGKLADFYGLWLNHSTRSVLVMSALTRGGVGTRGLYQITNGRVTPLVLPGQEMPGGGKLAVINAVSSPNDTDQYALLASLGDGATAAYLLDASGKLSLVLKSGTVTDLGAIASLGTPASAELASGDIALNNRGQVALSARIMGGPAVILLLTPTAP
jgi:hypothetical protein